MVNSLVHPSDPTKKIHNGIRNLFQKTWRTNNSLILLTHLNLPSDSEE